jgi:hypothetical protein
MFTMRRAFALLGLVCLFVGAYLDCRDAAAQCDSNCHMRNYNYSCAGSKCVEFVYPTCQYCPGAPLFSSCTTPGAGGTCQSTNNQNGYYVWDSCTLYCSCTGVNSVDAYNFSGEHTALQTITLSTCQ